MPTAITEGHRIWALPLIEWLKVLECTGRARRVSCSYVLAIAVHRVVKCPRMHRSRETVRSRRLSSDRRSMPLITGVQGGGVVDAGRTIGQGSSNYGGPAAQRSLPMYMYVPISSFTGVTAAPFF
jgi:hypothetical protein